MSTIDPGGSGGAVGGFIVDPSGQQFPSTSSGGGGSSSATVSGRSLGLYWKGQISHAEKAFDAWIKRGENVVKRYRDERDRNISRNRFNILWSNVQVLKPSLYGRAAKPEVSRRYKDHDPVGRVASLILERALSYEIEQFPDFASAMEQVCEDRLLPGRGTVWVRYEPVIESMEPPDGTEGPPIERVDEAHSPVDYVYWQDFLHSPARTWDEVTWVARKVFMTREEGLERFGEIFAGIPLKPYESESTVTNKSGLSERFIQKALVYEIWDKEKKNVCWIAEGFPNALDEREDPLKLEGFFPCPKPLYATMTNGTLIPIPDYCEYQDQAEELDTLTWRISFLVRAIKAVGIFDSKFKELSRLFNEGTDNKMFPVENYAALAEKGGLKGGVELLDLTTQLQALGALYTSREQIKQTIYEICGISDILRGSTKAEETLGAQQLKANFGSLRLKNSQQDVARFASDIFRLKAQIIANPKLYPPELLLQMSGILETTDGQNQDVVAQALQLIADSTVRDFHITVSSDTLAQIDEDAAHEANGQMLAAVGGLMQQALPAIQTAPELLPMMAEIIKQTMRCYKSGRTAEAATDQSFQLLTQRLLAQQQNPQPSEAEIEAKAKSQSEQMRIQMDAQAAQMKEQFAAQREKDKLQQEGQLEAMKAQFDQAQARLEAQLKMMQVALEQNTERYKVDKQSATAITVAQIGAESRVDAAEKRPAPASQP